MGGPPGAALGAGFGAFAKPLASSVSRFMGNVGTQKPTDTELMIRMPAERAPPAAPPASSEIAYTVPQKSLPSEVMDFTTDRATDFLYSSMAFPVAVSDTMMKWATKLATLMRGELDWIVMRALEKDRARRYDTANGLALDIERHLTHEPVEARPPSTAYRFQKAFRRNKLAFGAAGAVASGAGEVFATVWAATGAAVLPAMSWVLFAPGV